MTAMPTSKHPLHDSIGRHQIRRVAVVDDAFDPVSLASLQEGEDREFITAVNAEDELLKEFHKLVSGTANDDLLRQTELTDQAVALLWENRRTLAGLSPVLSSTLFRVLERKVSQVELLCSFLKDELGIETVDRYGTTSEQPHDAFDVAFIDYRFGPSGQTESVDRAIRWATHLYHKGRTFIILMSAEAGARRMQEIFREASKLTRGLFEFLDKEEIEDSGKFCNRLNSFCAGLKTRHEIHRFATAAEAAATEALAALNQSLHTLGIEDYAYLEQISLQEDGHPLGDYMLWLFGEYFAHNLSVNGSLQAARKNVNALKYDRFLPLQRPPSVMLAKMYSAAITEPVYEGWGPHPRILQKEAEAATERETGGCRPPEGGEASAAQTIEVHSVNNAAAGAPQEGGAQVRPGTAGSDAGEAPEPQLTASMPLYQLGDLLVANKDKPVFLVLNAGCDLQFSPGERDCDTDQSILLIPGRFERLHERGSETSVKRTELFELGGARFRIIWQHTRAVALPYHRILPEYRSQGYERNWRLKLPYALEVQQHFAAQLTRIGLPTPAPVFRERPVEVYGKDTNGDCRQLGTVDSGIVVFHHRQRDQFVLTVDCVHKVLSYIGGFIAEVESELSEASETTGAPAQSSAAALKESPVDAAAGSGDRTSNKGTPGEREPAKEAQTRARRRKKYVDELKESRTALAHLCIFQDRLSDLPALGGAVPQIDEISSSDKRTRLEVRHATSLSGRFPGNAPVILAFSLPDVISTLPTSNAGAKAETSTSVDQQGGIGNEERTQP